MSVVFENLFIFYAFLLAGFLFGKKEPKLQQHTSVLSFLLCNLLLPCKLFANFSKNFTVSYIKSGYKLILAGIVLIVFLHFLSKLLTHFITKNKYEKKVYEYSLTISNYSYLGYALIEGVFGEAMLTDMIAFCIFFAAYSYTVGYTKLTGEWSAKKLCNPMFISVLLGMIVGLSGLKLPEFFGSVFALASSSVAPLSMLLTGIALSAFSLKEILKNGKAYIVVALRLVVIPLIVFLLCKGLRLDYFLPLCLIVSSMPTGLNSIVFAEKAGESPIYGARLAFLSHLFSIITFPLIICLI